jgi:hypothetical protein
MVSIRNIINQKDFIVGVSFRISNPELGLLRVIEVQQYALRST